MFTIDKSYPSKNRTPRVFFLVLHYTQLDLQASLNALTKAEVSAHYLVTEKAGLVYQLVDESERAFHAGISAWQGRDRLNDTSIGIEIVHLGLQKDSTGCDQWLPYNADQIQTVIDLSKDIVTRYAISPTRVVAHSDIAPNRKIDPGPLFPWKQLADAGVGAWYDQSDVDAFLENNTRVDMDSVKKNLETYGYNLQQADLKNIIGAFQMHFRPSNYSGVADLETAAILNSLVKKYSVSS